MLPTLTQHSISLQLTPMQIPEAAPQSGLLGLAEQTVVTSGNASLVLHPGDPSRMSVQIQNWESHALRLTFQIEGNFPLHWCRMSLGELGLPVATNLEWQAVDSSTIEVPSKGVWYGELLFLVPETFFEDPDADIVDRDRLKLNFRSCLSVYAHSDHEGGGMPKLMQQSDVDLYVRPHSTYVTFLPLLYREVDFISRFIKVFEQAFEPVVNSFTSMWANLDPLTAPEALLPFLSHWVAWSSDPSWDLHQQRQLIKRAIELYRWRGTRKGLRLYLHLYTGLPLDDQMPSEADRAIAITEPFGRGFELGGSSLGVDAVIGGGQPYQFAVRLRLTAGSLIDEPLVRRIIDHEKPAFCTYELIIEPPS